MTMKRTALILLILSALIFIAIGAYFFLSRGQDVAPPAQFGGNPFGFAGTGTVGTENALELVLEDGSSVSIPDFTKIDQPEWAGESAGYQVAGNADADFLITYIPADTYGSQAQFLVSLATEPLGEIRADAEAALRTRLSLSNQELCGLDVQVWTDDAVNAAYAGRDLGLSFCPGATVLP